MTTIRFHGLRFKPQLAAAVRKRGVRVLERTMGVDLLRHGQKVVGAVALNVRNNDFTVIKAKATIVATGMVQRIFNPEDGAPWKNKIVLYGCGRHPAHRKARTPRRPLRGSQGAEPSMAAATCLSRRKPETNPAFLT